MKIKNIAKSASGVQNCVHQRRFAMVNMGDYGDIFDFHFLPFFNSLFFRVFHQ